jgi:hypothetical protein
MGSDFENFSYSVMLSILSIVKTHFYHLGSNNSRGINRKIVETLKLPKFSKSDPDDLGSDPALS